MTNDDDLEYSESGSPIFRHQPKKEEWQPAEDAGRNLEDIEAHVEKYIGKVETVFHEIVSDRVHLDILFIPATDDRPFHVVMTSGVSDLPMLVPEGMDDFNRVELLMALPKEWPLTDKAFRDENNYWPIRWLKMIGRLPHDYDTWIGWGHTIPNGDPAEPIANTNFTGFLLTPPYWLDSEFFKLHARNGDIITFYELMPLYEEEMQLKLSQGAEALEERFEQAEIGFILDIHRENVAI